MNLKKLVPQRIKLLNLTQLFARENCQNHDRKQTDEVITMNSKFLTLVSLTVLGITAISGMAQAVQVDNALAKNALTKNALTKNGVRYNALAKNGVKQNALTKNNAQVQNSIQISGATGMTLTNPEFSVIQVEGGRLVGVK